MCVGAFLFPQPRKEFCKNIWWKTSSLSTPRCVDCKREGCFFLQAWIRCIQNNVFFCVSRDKNTCEVWCVLNWCRTIFGQFESEEKNNVLKMVDQIRAECQQSKQWKQDSPSRFQQQSDMKTGSGGIRKKNISRGIATCSKSDGCNHKRTHCAIYVRGKINVRNVSNVVDALMIAVE